MPSLNDLRKLDREDVLELLGLQQRRQSSDWLLPALGAFSVGVMVGVSVGLMLAPKPGEQLRDDLRARMQGGGPDARRTSGAPSAQPQSQSRSA